MPVPLPLALPAAAAGLAYLNAKTSLWWDLRLISSALPAAINSFARQYFDQINAFYQLESHAKNKSSANRTFLLFEDRSYTYAQVYDFALRYGHWLKQHLGVQPKDIVAIDFMNSDTFIFLWMGSWAIGAKPAFINYNLTGRPLVHCVKAATARVMVLDPRVGHTVTEDVKKELEGVNIVLFDQVTEGEARAADPVRQPDQDRSEDLSLNMAMLIYTSGTTGLPKPAIFSWAKFTVISTLSSRLIGIKKTDIFYTCMPLYHSSAAAMGFGNALAAGATFALGHKFSTKTFWSEVRQHNATIIQYVGETCRYLLAAQPQLDPATGANLDKQHGVRIAFGNGLRPDVWNRFKERFGLDTITEFYAATEGSFATFNSSRNDYTTGAIGRNGSLYGLVMGGSVAVVEMDFSADMPLRDAKTGLCRRVMPGEPGEFLFRLPADEVEKRFQGYFGNADATRRKIMRDVFAKGDAWFRSGDVVRWDGEGRLFFTDRIGDTFRWKSENVSTAEVSQAVGLHPAVREANVYGVELPGHDGRAGCVALVMEGQGQGGRELDEKLLQALAEHVRKTLPKYALPIFLRVVQDPHLHSTGTNKQQKHGLRTEGVDPDKVGEDKLYWLKDVRDGAYAPFGRREWEMLQGGKVKL